MLGGIGMNNKAEYTPEKVVDISNLSREDWLEYRKKGIGGSDVAAIMGISPFATIRDLFYSLTTAEVANMYRSSALRLNLFPQGFNDGTVIPKEGFSVIASGNYNRVPVILGSDVTEFSSFAIKTDITEALSTTTTTTYDRLMQLAIQYGSLFQSEHDI